MAHKATGRLIFYALLVITVLYTTLVFAVFKSARDRTFSRIGTLYSAAFKTPEKTTATRVEVHERKIVQLPPPAPATPSIVRGPQVTFKPGQSKPAPVRSPREVDEVITETKEEAPAPRAAVTKKPETAPAREPATPVVAKGKEQETAFQNLLAGNKSIADLVNHSDPKLKFKGWSPIKSEGDEHWIDVAFQNTSDNSDIHYVWSINNASKKIVPINHFAKRLAAK